MITKLSKRVSESIRVLESLKNFTVYSEEYTEGVEIEAHDAKEAVAQFNHEYGSRSGVITQVHDEDGNEYRPDTGEKITSVKDLDEGFEGRDWSVKKATFEVAVKDKDLSKLSGRGFFDSLGKILEDNKMILMGDLLYIDDADTKVYIDNDMISDEDFESLGESKKITESAGGSDFFKEVDEIVSRVESLNFPLDEGEVDKAVDAIIKIKGAVRAQLIGTQTVLKDMKTELGDDAGSDIDEVIAKIDKVF